MKQLSRNSSLEQKVGLLAIYCRSVRTYLHTHRHTVFLCMLFCPDLTHTQDHQLPKMLQNTADIQNGGEKSPQGLLGYEMY